MSGIFGKGGGDNSALMMALAMEAAQQQQTQGQQLKQISKTQAQADDEAAGLARPGLGRAMLSFSRKEQGAQTLGG